ncbi:hypothetical protein M406DRAFT_47211 [Cryphonectria parasitica EP155]|uniref:DUF952 domain-containing protein n=1 Tax=Cryphonectria parasitica (strain ATCC 38755 / EP155) TaxID=660469 RepID=A0A9P5CKE4_CRYP1|nr:uncharacterized protein M406DRAFT_47211 [Cryphonectria parasitica EP155]KAF3760670.1 hypothetical protein M406DRAFT_47211 [Cryphonectria parasitica EP155]
MPAPKVLPEYVYKIVDSEPPSPIPDVFPPSELDRQDGFIHLSTARQVTGLFFATHTTLWLIKIRLAPLTSSSSTTTTTNTIKWDDPPNDNDGCPHLYGTFGAADVDSVEKFERVGGEEAGWKEVFGASKWLE